MTNFGSMIRKQATYYTWLFSSQWVKLSRLVQYRKTISRFIYGFWATVVAIDTIERENSVSVI